MSADRILSKVADRRLLLAVTLAAVFAAFLGPISSYDAWWHLRAGQVVAGSGIPHADVFSFTRAGAGWTYHSWLAGLSFYAVWRVAGLTGLVVLRAVLLAGALVLAWFLACERRVGPAVASVLVLAACLQLRERAHVRPYLFSLLIFALYARILQRAFAATPSEPRSVRGWLWRPGARLAALPALMLLWANLHAGFVAGFLLLGAYGVGELVRVRAERGDTGFATALLRSPEGARFRAMFLTGILALAAALVTPYGPHALLYPFRLVWRVRFVEGIEEWQPAPFTVNYAVFWAVLGLGALVLGRSLVQKLRRAEKGPGQLAVDLLLFAGFGAMAIAGRRHVAWVMLLAPAILGANRPRPEPDGERRRETLYAAAAIVLAAVVAVAPLTREGVFGVDRSRLPVAAADFMEEQGLTYRPFNEYAWGGYLIYRFWPRQRVFIDGRTLLYGDEIIGRYLTVLRGEPGWQGVLAGHDVEMLVLRHPGLSAPHFFGGGRWRCVYWDDAAVLALREDVLRAHGRRLPELALSNPFVFEASLETAAPAQLLSELELVLERRPDCATALAYRARCLVRLAGVAEAAEAQSLRKEALRLARRAVELRPRRPATWRAMEEAARAAGLEGLAERAAQKADELAAED